MSQKKYTQEQFEKARKRAKNKADFFRHFITYVVVIVLLTIVNVVTSWRIISGGNFNFAHLWVVWVILGWGVAVVIHGVSAFLSDSLIDDYEEKELEKELKKIK